MALAVSTPDIAKDLFAGLWDVKHDPDLYEAYESMDGGYNATSAPYIYPACSYEVVVQTSHQRSYQTTPSPAPYHTTPSPVPYHTTPSPAPYHTTPPPPYQSPGYHTSSNTSVYQAAPSSNTSVYQAAPSPNTSVYQSGSSSNTSPYQQIPSPVMTTSCSQSRAKRPRTNTSISRSQKCAKKTPAGETSKTEECDKDVSEVTKLALLLISQSQKKDLPKAEQEKRRLRRERNKIAATKCREKRRAHSSHVTTEYAEVSSKTKQLEEEISELQRERDELSRLLDTHYCHVPTLTPSHHHSMTPQHINPDDLFVKDEPLTPQQQMKSEPYY